MIRREPGEEFQRRSCLHSTDLHQSIEGKRRLKGGPEQRLHLTGLWAVGMQSRADAGVSWQDEDNDLKRRDRNQRNFKPTPKKSVEQPGDDKTVPDTRGDLRGRVTASSDAG